MSVSLPLAGDSAIALGIASTALPFARSREAASECWLRILRLHGDAASALQALGVGEDTIADEPPSSGGQARPAAADARFPEVTEVLDAAGHIAEDRSSECIATTDLLSAVMDVYGEAFEHALQSHGTDCDEVRERLLAQHAA